MILVFPEETYITILPALYYLELDHFSPSFIPLSHTVSPLPCLALLSIPHSALTSTPHLALTSTPCLVPLSTPCPIPSSSLHIASSPMPHLALSSTARHKSSTHLIHLNQPSIPSSRLEKSRGELANGG